MKHNFGWAKLSQYLAVLHGYNFKKALKKQNFL